MLEPLISLLGHQPLSIVYTNSLWGPKTAVVTVRTLRRTDCMFGFTGPVHSQPGCHRTGGCERLFVQMSRGWQFGMFVEEGGGVGVWGLRDCRIVRWRLFCWPFRVLCLRSGAWGFAELFSDLFESFLSFAVGFGGSVLTWTMPEQTIK